MILALDCATKTGFCLLKDGKVYESGVMDFSKKRGESNGVMFMRFRQWLRGILNTGRVDPLDEPQVKLVVYEQAHHRGGAATEIAVNLTGRIQELCAEKEIEFTTVHTTTLKKHATGRGNADKDAMIARATQILGRPPEDDNEADAVLLALYAWDEYEVR